jgi:hypothetical protein
MFLYFHSKHNHKDFIVLQNPFRKKRVFLVLFKFEKLTQKSKSYEIAMIPKAQIGMRNGDTIFLKKKQILDTYEI